MLFIPLGREAASADVVPILQPKGRPVRQRGAKELKTLSVPR